MKEVEEEVEVLKKKMRAMEEEGIVLRRRVREMEGTSQGEYKFYRRISAIGRRGDRDLNDTLWFIHSKLKWKGQNYAMRLLSLGISKILTRSTLENYKLIILLYHVLYCSLACTNCLTTHYFEVTLAM